MHKASETSQKRKRRHIIWCCAVAYASGSFFGCSQVRFIRETPDGGVVVLPNNSDQWPSYYRNRAEFLMKKKCPEGYIILSEREAEDNPAQRDGRKPNEDFEYEGGYIRLSTYNRKAYFIAFRSTAAAKSASPPLSHLPPAPAKEKHSDELPPPRPLSSEPQKAKRASGVSDR